MNDEEILLEQYKFVREDLKRIVNEENEYDNVKFWGNDIVERVRFMCHLKQKIFKGKELDKKCENLKH